MSKKPNAEIIQLLSDLNSFASTQLSALTKETEAIIKRREKDPQIIACLLDVLASLVEIGEGQSLFARLYKYYMQVDPIGAELYSRRNNSW